MLLEAARDAGIRHLQISTDEVYGSIESGSFTEQSPLDPSSPYSASKAGGDLIVSAFHHTYGADALLCRSSNNYGPYQHPEKLIPLCVLNALAGDPLPVYGDGMQVRNWLFVEDNCAAIDTVLERGEAGEVYNVGGPDEMANIDVVRRILELTGRDESLIEYVTDRPGHDRRYSLASDKVRGPGLDGGRVVRRGHRAHGRLVPRQRLVVGADPLGRVPRVLRAPVRARARAEWRAGSKPSSRARADRARGSRRRARLHGRDLPRRGVARARRRRRFRAGEPLALGARHPARASLPDRPGQAKLVRCARGRIWDVVVDLRRDSPTYRRWEGHELDDEAHRQLFVPVGFAHGFCVLSDVADVTYKLSSLYDPETESGIAWDDPDVGVEWPVTDPVLSERDQSAPRLSEVADELPW